MSAVHHILLDEGLEAEVANALRKVTRNFTDLVAFRLNDSYDSKGERQIVLTQNRQVMGNRTFPSDRKTTLVILTGEPNEPLLTALMSALLSTEREWNVWEGATVVVSDNGRVAATIHDRDTGRRQTFHYKLRLAGPPLIWIRPSHNDRDPGINKNGPLGTELFYGVAHEAAEGTPFWPAIALPAGND